MSKIYLSSIKWIQNLFEPKSKLKGANPRISSPTAAIAAMEAIKPQKETRGANPWISEPKGFLEALETYRSLRKEVQS